MSDMIKKNNLVLIEHEKISIILKDFPGKLTGSMYF